MTVSTSNLTASELQLIHDYRAASKLARSQIERIALAERNLRSPEPDTRGALDRITLATYAHEGHITARYEGIAGDLLASGAIEPGMELPGRNGKCRVDSHGDYFRRDKKKDGRITILRQITSFERAVALPKVPPDLRKHELIEWLDTHPGRTLSVPSAWSSHTLVHYGTRTTLCDAGHATDEMFDGHYNGRSKQKYSNCGCYEISSLMGRYFSVRFFNQTPNDGMSMAILPRDTPAETETSQSSNGALKRVFLHLAWTNPAMRRRE